MRTQVLEACTFSLAGTIMFCM